MSRTKKNLVIEEFKTIELTDTPRFRNFDWDKAKSFYYVAKCGSFVNAGRFLNISQSALSRQVIYLEHHLGCPLFSRHSGGVKLTRKGKDLFSIVEKTFVELKGFTQNIHAKITKEKKRKIRISATHAVAAYILSNVMFNYQKKNSHLYFELITHDHLIDIFLNDVDIAIRPYDPLARGVQQEYLFTLEKKLYASIGYLEKNGEPRTVEELKNHHIIAPANPEEYPYSELNWILKLGMSEGKFHEPIFTSTSLECLIEAAKNGIGIIGGYEEMIIIRTSGLKNILSEIKDKKVKDYFIYPNYLKNDADIISIKEYLQENLSF